MDIGIDIEKVRRFRLKRTSRFLLDNFTDYEIRYAFSKTNPEMHLCGLFSAKEAVIKTLKKKVMMKDIEVKSVHGKPTIHIKNMRGKFIVSISHCDEYAIANVIRI